MKRLCYFGTYTIAEGYPVNRVLLKGLRDSGIDIIECRQELWEGVSPGVQNLHQVFSQRRFSAYLRLAGRMLSRYPRLFWQYWQAGEHAGVIVGYAGYLDVVFARLLRRRGRPLILVSFISLYDTIVVDRGQLNPNGLKARLIKKIDRMAFRCADVVLVDTCAQRQYYARLFGLPPEKFERSFVGEDDTLFKPATPKPALTAPEPADKVYKVLFFGTYVPLHGIDTIIAAAQLLRCETGIELLLIGNGQLYATIRRQAEDLGLSNVRFIDTWVSSERLLEYIQEADVGLGIFGTTAKADRVIPYKVFDVLAARKPIITRDSPAIRELLSHNVNALLCKPGDEADLAQSICRLRSQPALAQRLAAAGHACYKSHASPLAIGKAFNEMWSQRFGF